MRDSNLTPKDTYIQSLTPVESQTKKLSRQASEDLGLARISVNSAEAQLIKVLLKIHGARKVVEIGTLTGLSAQYILEALPADGELWTLEKNPDHAQKAQDIFSQLTTTQRIHLIRGDAREKLEEISSQGLFDAVFIDGNKAAYGDYLAWAEKNLRAGGLIVADNIFLSGAVWGESLNQNFSAKQIKVMQDFNVRLADSALYDSVVIPTYEGLFVAVKK